MSISQIRTGTSALVKNEGGLVFRCLSPDELASDRNWWTIYEDSFPADEREPREVIISSLLRGVGLAFAARSENETIGLATTHLLKRPPAVFLVYLAIARHWRCNGSGGALLEYVWRTSEERLSDWGLLAVGLIWEVDSPDQPADDRELENRARRIAFFRRHQGQLVSRPYLQPPVNGVAPVPMSLMFRPAEGVATPDQTMIDRLVHAIYFEKYGDTNHIPHDILWRLLQAGENTGAWNND
jgi:hypothetical protein